MKTPCTLVLLGLSKAHIILSWFRVFNIAPNMMI